MIAKKNTEVIFDASQNKSRIMHTSNANTERTLGALQEWFADCPFAIVAFSGGVDSSLVSFVANRFLGGDRNWSVISDSPSLKRSELEAATEFCRQHGIPLRVIKTAELSNPAYASNPSNRCYHCKHTLYGELQSIAASLAGSWLLNGTNVDDLGDYRPGLQAADEFRIRSPLAECGLDKQAVRALAAALGLECWDKPASPCLSSRIAYGQPVTEAKLRQIEQAEAILAAAGFRIARVRHFGSEARIEVPVEEIRRLREAMPNLEWSLLQLGFARVTVDPEGFVSGKLNRSIQTPSVQLPIL
jgi:uncharacterized protein